jgi:hypothetical protein
MAAYVAPNYRRLSGVPTGIRTPVLTVKGWCPRPLDDGDAGRKETILELEHRQKSGGARRDRTADLLHAMQALSQLSYGPTWRRGTLPDESDFVKKMNRLRGRIRAFAGPARNPRRACPGDRKSCCAAGCPLVSGRDSFWARLQRSTSAGDAILAATADPIHPHS